MRSTKSLITEAAESALARPLAPEDVRCRQYVSILDEIVEFPSFLFCSEDAIPGADPIRRMKLRSDEAGWPLRVMSVQTPQLQTRILDLRRYRLVRLSRDYGKQVWKALRKQSLPCGL